METSPAGLLVPDGTTAPPERRVIHWSRARTKQMLRMADQMRKEGLAYIFLCEPCGVAGRNPQVQLIQVKVLNLPRQTRATLECPCTVRIMDGA
jgi:hypothetical protein